MRDRFLDGTFGYGGKPVELYHNSSTPIPVGPVEGKNSYAWSHLSFSPHEVDTTKWILSIGWFKDPKGDFPQMLLNVPAGKPEPSKLTSADGPVVYELFQMSTNFPRSTGGMQMYSFPVGYTIMAGEPQGKVVLQVNPDGSLSLEFGGEFTSAKRTYGR